MRSPLMEENMPATDCLVFSGNGHDALAARIAGLLGARLGRMQLGRFPDGEHRAKIIEDVAGLSCIVVCLISDSDTFIQSVLIADALRRHLGDALTDLTSNPKKILVARQFLEAHKKQGMG